MNYLMEHVVKVYQHETLRNFGRIAVEVYIAYLLERLIEHFHEAIWKLLAMALRKMQYCRQAMATEVLPAILAQIQKSPEMLRQAIRKFLRIIWEFYSRIIHKRQ